MAINSMEALIEPPVLKTLKSEDVSDTERNQQEQRQIVMLRRLAATQAREQGDQL